MILPLKVGYIKLVNTKLNPEASAFYCHANVLETRTRQLEHNNKLTVIVWQDL